jgi:signal peptidase II
MSMSETGDLSTPTGQAAPPAPAAGPAAAEGSGWRWLPLGVSVIALDQLVKWLVVTHLRPFEPVPVLSPVLDFILLFNTGAAFSFLADAQGWQRWLFIALAFAASIGIVVWLGRLKARSQGLLAASLALILGGALGNVIDRFALGHVVDFIDVHWKGHHFPAFNVADSAITVGAALLLLDVWREGRGSRSKGRT